MERIEAKSDYGKSGQYVARINGRDSKFTFDREFVGRKQGKRNEWTEFETDEPGLYESCSVRKRGKDSTYVLIVDTKCPERLAEYDCPLKQHYCDKADALKIARALENGRKFDEIVESVNEKQEDGSIDYQWRIMSAAEAKKQLAAQTVETALDGCWEILQSLPTKEAKKVLAALRKKVSPPKDETKEETPVA